MRTTEPGTRARRTPLRGAGLTALAAAAVLAMSGCTAADGRRLGLPEGITTLSGATTRLWQGAWIAAFTIGAIVWGLIIWAVIAYRRRGNEMPAQTRYNMPIEALYTIMPIVVVMVLFFYTARDESNLRRLVPDPDQQVEVYGYRFSWTFGYSDPQNRYQPVYDVGTNSTLPELWVPRGETVQYNLVSNDVIHAFWVPAFLDKMDVIPGRVNSFDKTVTTLGTYPGRCSELCGINHAHMLFTVRVVTPAQYLQHMADLAARGQTGRPDGHLTPAYDPNRSVGEGRGNP